MKKLFLCIVFISISILTFASEATELLEKAKKEYSDGNLTESIILIENAKSAMVFQNSSPQNTAGNPTLLTIKAVLLQLLKPNI